MLKERAIRRKCPALSFTRWWLRQDTVGCPEMQILVQIVMVESEKHSVETQACQKVPSQAYFLVNSDVVIQR